MSVFNQSCRVFFQVIDFDYDFDFFQVHANYMLQIFIKSE